MHLPHVNVSCKHGMIELHASGTLCLIENLEKKPTSFNPKMSCQGNRKKSVVAFEDAKN